MDAYLYHWVQHDAPEIEKRLRWYYKPTMGFSWRADETYMKVKGEWAYLYRAVDAGSRKDKWIIGNTGRAYQEKSV